MVNDTVPSFDFPAVRRKKVTAAFDGGRLTSDGGVMLLSLAEQRLGIAERLARLIPDRRELRGEERQSFYGQVPPLYVGSGWTADRLLWMAIRPKETFGLVMAESTLHIEQEGSRGPPSREAKSRNFPLNGVLSRQPFAAAVLLDPCAPVQP